MMRDLRLTAALALLVLGLAMPSHADDRKAAPLAPTDADRAHAKALPAMQQNAALYYWRAAHVLAELADPDDESEDPLFLDDVASGRVAIDGTVRAKIDERLPSLDDAVHEALRGTLFGQCRFGTWEPDAETSMMVHIGIMRPLSRALLLRGRLAEADERPDDALTCYLACLTIGRHVGQESALVGGLLGIATVRRGTEALREWIVRHGTRARLEALIATLERDHGSPIDWAEVLRSETRFGAGIIAAGKPTYVDLMRRYVLLAAKPYHEAVPEVLAIDREFGGLRAAMDPRAFRPGDIVPMLHTSMQKRALLTADARALIVGCHVQLARLEHGAYPDALPEKARTADLCDPFTTKPFAYEKRDDGFVLSCGKDPLEDDAAAEPIRFGFPNDPKE